MQPRRDVGRRHDDVGSAVKIFNKKIMREGDGAITVGGRRLIGGHNNQLNSVSTVGEISGKARDHGGTYGGAVLAAFGQQLKYDEALNGCQMINYNTTTSQKQAAATKGTIEGRRDEREARGSKISSFLEGEKSN